MAAENNCFHLDINILLFFTFATDLQFKKKEQSTISKLFHGANFGFDN